MTVICKHYQENIIQLLGNRIGSFKHTLKTGKYLGCLGFDLNMCLIVNQVQESQEALALNDSTLPKFIDSLNAKTDIFYATPFLLIY